MNFAFSFLRRGNLNLPKTIAPLEAKLGALQNNPAKKDEEGTPKGYPNLVFSLKIEV